MFTQRFLLTLCIALSWVSVTHAQDQSDVFSTLLQGHGLNSETIQLSAKRWNGGKIGRLEVFDRLSSNWRELEPTAKRHGKQMLEHADHFYDLLDQAYSITFAQVTRIHPQHFSVYPPIEEIISQLYGLTDLTLTDAENSTIANQAKTLSPQMLRIASGILVEIRNLLQTHPYPLKNDEQYALAANFASGFYPINPATKKVIQTIQNASNLIEQHAATFHNLAKAVNLTNTITQATSKLVDIRNDKTNKLKTHIRS